LFLEINEGERVKISFPFLPDNGKSQKTNDRSLNFVYEKNIIIRAIFGEAEMAEKKMDIHRKYAFVLKYLSKRPV